MNFLFKATSLYTNEKKNTSNRCPNPNATKENVMEFIKQKKSITKGVKVIF